MLKAAFTLDSSFSGKCLTKVFLLFLFCTLLFSCGRKAMPVAPKLVLPPMITDFKAVVKNGRAELVWSLPKQSVARDKKIESFYLYRAETDVADAACDDCPKQFEQIAEILMQPHHELPTGKYQWRYVIPIDPNFKYSFKLRILASGSLGPDSNIVELEP